MPIAIDPGLEHRNMVERLARASVPDNRQLWKQASSESTGLEHKGTLPPSVTGTGVSVFNAIDLLPPNPAVTANVIGERPIAPFLALSSKLEKGTSHYSATGVISHQKIPRDNRVSTLVRQGPIIYLDS